MSNHNNYEYDRRENETVEPQLHGYQLIGDSQFVRFSEHFLDKKRTYQDGLAYIGLCVSGQKIADLFNRVRDDFHPTMDKAILMIGTNDLLKNTPVKDMCSTLKRLLNELQDRGVTRIIILTIPPVPRLRTSNSHWDTLLRYNKCIRQLNDGLKIFTLDTGPLFMMQLKNQSPTLANTSSVYKPNTSSSSSVYTNGTTDDEDNYVESCKRRRMSQLVYFRGKSRESSPNSGSRNSHNFVSSSPTKTNLRISINRTNNTLSGSDVLVGQKRKVYELEEEDEPDTPNNSYCSTSSVEYRSPNYKRRLSSYTNTDTALDDHNDSFVNEESSSGTSTNWVIRNDLFEQFFGNDQKRPDLIHLNKEGLGIIRYRMVEKIRKCE